VTENQRLKLLSLMGSKLATNVPKPSTDDIHKLPLRLAKIPQDCGTVGDKGLIGLVGIKISSTELQRSCHTLANCEFKERTFV